MSIPHYPYKHIHYTSCTTDGLDGGTVLLATPTDEVINGCKWYLLNWYDNELLIDDRHFGGAFVEEDREGVECFRDIEDTANDGEGKKENLHVARRWTKHQPAT